MNYSVESTEEIIQGLEIMLTRVTSETDKRLIHKIMGVLLAKDSIIRQLYNQIKPSDL